MAKLLSVSGKNANLLMFAPEKWGEVGKFQEFYGQTFHLRRRARAALRGIQCHFRRAELLLSLIKARADTLRLDHEEERLRGYSTNQQGEQLAALVELFACELYSSVDCTNQVIRSAFPKAQGIADKTSGSFRNAKARKLDNALPQLIQVAFISAEWYEDLRSIRTTATHSDAGMCRMNRTTGRIEYDVNCDFHSGRPLHFDDIIARMDGFFRGVNRFHGCVFHALNSSLKDGEQLTLCMIANGRFYHRRVRPSEVKDIHSGICDSFAWFESGDHPPCPRMGECGAYRRAKLSTSA